VCRRNRGPCDLEQIAESVVRQDPHIGTGPLKNCIQTKGGAVRERVDRRNVIHQAGNAVKNTPRRLLRRR
jgi:hypothetical protein